MDTFGIIVGAVVAVGGLLAVYGEKFTRRARLRASIERHQAIAEKLPDGPRKDSLLLVVDQDVDALVGSYRQLPATSGSATKAGWVMMVAGGLYVIASVGSLVRFGPNWDGLSLVSLGVAFFLLGATVAKPQWIDRIRIR